MSRAVLAVMAGLLCTLAGLKHASTLQGDASRLERWVQLLQHLALLLKEGTLSIPEALCAAADQSYPPDKLLHDLAGRIADSPMLTLSAAYRECGTEGPEHDLLLRMFSRLGHGSKENRCLALEQSAEEMNLLARNALVKAQKDAKLWRTLGLIGGACLTILLI